MSDEQSQASTTTTNDGSASAWKQWGATVAPVVERWDSWGASSIVPSVTKVASGIDSILPVDPLGAVEHILDEMAEQRDRWAQRVEALPATVDKMSTTTRVLAMGGMAAGAALVVAGVLLPASSGKR